MLHADLAAEVTLQPIRRFGFDAAILLADILVVPDALGQSVRFLEGEGPRLEVIRSEADLARLNATATRPKFDRIFETVARVRQGLPHETALIGFCGAPWTVATYMVGGQGSADQADTRLWAYREPQAFQRLIDLLAEVSVDYLAGQIEAGADVVQIFDSWAGSLPDDQFHRWVVEPTKRMVARLKERHPAVPVIGFPRGAGIRARLYADETGVDGVSCDTAMPLDFAARELAGRKVVQGNLDPLLLGDGRTGAGQAGRRNSGRPVPPAVHFQPGPRHRAPDATGECGAPGGASTSCAKPVTVIPGPCARDPGIDRRQSERRDLDPGDKRRDRQPHAALAEGAARDGRHLLDGGAALSAAAVRLPL